MTFSAKTADHSRAVAPTQLDLLSAHASVLQKALGEAAETISKQGVSSADCRDAIGRHWQNVITGRFGPAHATSANLLVTLLGNSGNGLGPYIAASRALLCRLIQAVIVRKAGMFRPKDDTFSLQMALTEAAMLDLEIVVELFADELRTGRIKSVQDMTDGFEKKIDSILDQVALGANGLHTTAQGLNTMSQQVLSQASTVASASEDASLNVQTVAAAAEELVASIAEISRQVSDAGQIANKAVADAGHTASQIQELSSAARNIGEVVQIINSIAAQTNLLALNATIEAARAGEAGRGFAVVASEVKQLADQTAKATQTISAQIQAIQSSTDQSVAAISGITDVIASLSDVAGSIAYSVEQQGGATQEIAMNIQHLARGTQNVSDTIVGVTHTVSETASASQSVQTASDDMKAQARVLREEVSSFLRQARSA